MKTTEKLKLIDGTFSAMDGREILMNVFLSKIRFHEAKNFSSKERFGKDDESKTIRVPQLKECLKMIDKIIFEAEKNNQDITIKSEISILYTDKKNV